jgi:hypothetical protein
MNEIGIQISIHDNPPSPHFLNESGYIEVTVRKIQIIRDFVPNRSAPNFDPGDSAKNILGSMTSAKQGRGQYSTPIHTGLMRALEACADIFKSAKCTNYFDACGYDPT